MTERNLERIVCNCINTCGGKAFKWVCPGRRGVPDRICILPKGQIIFIEVKRPGLKDGLSPLQRKFITWLKSMGCIAWRISEKEVLLNNLRGLGYDI